MAFTPLDNETQLTLALTALAELGIDTPTLPDFTTLPSGTTTTDDVAKALRASKAKDPYLDPAVQKVWIAQQIQGATWIYQTDRDAQSQARMQVIRDASDNILDQLGQRFDTTAAQLTEAAAVVGDLANLRDLHVGVDPDHRVEAAMKAHRAEQTMATVLRAATLLDGLAGPQPGIGDGGEIFQWANPTPADLTRVYDKGRPTVWNTARAGVAFTLARTTSEVVARVQAHQTAVQRAREAAAQRAERMQRVG